MKRRAVGKPRHNQQGAALIIALLLVTLLGILVAELSHSVNVDARAVLNTGLDSQNTNAALGGIQYAMAVLAELDDDTQCDTLDDEWAKVRRTEIGRAQVTIRLIDECSRLNINGLTPPNSDEGNELDRLAGALGLSAEHIGSEAADWADLDDKGPFEAGAPNRGFLCTGELALLKGIDSSRLYGENGLAPYVTVWSDGKINLNTASKEVLQAVLPEEDSDIADAIIERRKMEPFGKVAELQTVSGLTGAVYQRLEKITCVAGSCFSVESTASIGPMTRAVRAVVTRDKGEVQVIYLEEQPPVGALSPTGTGDADG